MKLISLVGWVSVFRPFYEFLFPPLCFACGRPMERIGGRICPACLASLRRVSAADSLFQRALDRLQTSQGLAGLFVGYQFEDRGALQTLIHQLKYGGGRILGKELGEHLGSLILASGIGDGILVPVPLHRAKLRERGYNQAACVCEGIAAITGWPIRADVVVRCRYTLTQTKLSLAERRQNVRDAFVIRRNRSAVVRERNVFVVDDVITTGSTIGECGGVLLAAGAARVFACAIGLAE